MNTDQLRLIIQEDPSLYGLLPDVSAIAVELSNRLKEPDNSIRIGSRLRMYQRPYGLIMANC